MNKVILTFAVLFSIGLCACSKSQPIADVSKSETITIKANGSGNAYALDVRGVGKIVGDATITLMLNGAPYKTESLGGIVDFKWGGDWYSNTAEIVYRPMRVNSGSLVLKYEFHML
jgi:hypothetical protein